MARARHRLKRKYDPNVLRALLALGVAGTTIASIFTVESLTPHAVAQDQLAPLEALLLPTTDPIPPEQIFPINSAAPETTSATAPTIRRAPVLPPSQVAPKKTTPPPPPPPVKPAPAPQGSGGGGATAPFHPPSQPPAATSFASRFYATATSFPRNIPYTYGGKSLSGADCSGFIWLVLQKVAPGTPYRASGALNDWTTSITQAQAVPGDLVFWPGHAAIYAGNGQVLSQGGPGPGPQMVALWPGYSFGRIPL